MYSYSLASKTLRKAFISTDKNLGRELDVLVGREVIHTDSFPSIFVWEANAGAEYDRHALGSAVLQKCMSLCIEVAWQSAKV